MNSRCMRMVAAVIVMFLFSCAGFAQQTTKKTWDAASLDGTTGLFKTWDAETLRQWETNWTFGWDQYHRDPGDLTIGRGPFGAAVGLFDRFEVFGSMDIQKRVKARHIAIYRRFGQPEAVLPMQMQTGFRLYSQAAPFMDVPLAVGRGDIRAGIKFNLLSERRGNAFSMGVAGFGTFPGQQTATGLSRGLSSGSYQGGFALLFSKTAANFVRLHANVGTNFYADPDVEDVEVADFQHEFIYKGGLEMPVTRRVRLIGELSGIKYYGNRDDVRLNPKSPIDVIVGMRAFPARWLSLGAGYQASLNHVDDDAETGVFGAGYNGFVVQATLATRRNDPPTVTCAVAKQSILQAETTTIRASAMDPDGDTLTYSWTATGGKVTGNGDTATFDATGVAPGKYTVTVTVSDRKHQVTCSTDITVLKRNHAPTARVEPSTFNITQGEAADLRCIGSDPDNDPLTYSWSVDGQKLAAAGPQISFGSEGRNPGNYTVTCTVSDGEETATASASGTVKERIKPNQPPTIECLTTTMDVASGSSIDLKAKASDPDGDPLNYSWSATGGSITGTGENVSYSAAGVRAGSYTVTVTVDDGRGGKASCSMTVNVSERLSVTKEKCGFFSIGGTRVDNCAKAILDDLAVRMKNDPKLRANIIGYTDSREKRKGLGEKRAKAVAAYLDKQGVEASRLTITDGGSENPVGDNKKASGRTLNRRVEIELSVH